MSKNSDLDDSLLGFDSEFEPVGNNEVCTATDICPYCGCVVDLDQAYLGKGRGKDGGAFLCPNCGTRFDC